jgi:magnesium transporter
VPTLIAGIYGMNFDHMPKLHWTLGYPLALGMMAASAVALYLGFRKRGRL